MDDLAKRDYLRQRIESKPGDRYYPRLYRLGVSGRWYRLLFGSCTYHQGDLAGEPNLHFEHSAASLLPRKLKRAVS